MAFTNFTFHRWFLVSICLVFAWLFTDLAWSLHDGMRTHKADLGQIAQAVWNSSQGRFVEMTDNGPLSTRMTDHVEPILAIVSPVLWLWKDVKALLFLQVLFVTAGGWLLYEFASGVFRSLLAQHQRSHVWLTEPLYSLTAPVALALVAGYFLSPQIQNALLTEFHAAPLAVPLILWAFLAVENAVSGHSSRPESSAIPAYTQRSARKYWFHFVIATLLTASVKEEMALLAAGLGFWALYKLSLSQFKANRKNASSPVLQLFQPSIPHLVIFLTTILCLLWFYLATFVIVPAYAVEVYETAANPYWARYGALGNSPVDIVKSLITQPQTVLAIAGEATRVDHLWSMLAIFGFLSLLAPEILLLSLPLLLANLLSAYPPQYYGEFHYSAPLIAYFGVSAAYGARRLAWLFIYFTRASSPNYQHLPAASSWVMALVALVRNSRTTVRPLLFGLLTLWVIYWSVTEYWENGRGPMGGRYDPITINAHHQLLDRFVVQIPENAAVTATAAVHPHVALRRYVYQFPIGMPEFGEKGDADWALLDVTTNTDMASGDLHSQVAQMLAADWGIVDGADGFLLLQQGGNDKQIPTNFYNFARTSADERPTEQTSEQPLTLVDVSTEDWPRWRNTKVVTTWQVGVGFNSDQHAPKMAIHHPSGGQLFSFSDAAPTALIWYPPDKWQPGDKITVTTNALILPRSWGVSINATALDANHASNAVALTGAELASNDNMALAAAYIRTPNGRLTSVPTSAQFGSLTQISSLIGGTLSSQDIGTYTFHMENATGDNASLTLRSQLSVNDRQREAVVDLLLQWTTTSDESVDNRQRWPQGLTPFVHLRQVETDGSQTNLSQQDGLPRWFLFYGIDALQNQAEPIWDWRQLVVPAVYNGSDGVNPPNRELNIVVGLYDPDSGERAQVVDALGNLNGNEAVVGNVRLGKLPKPDFACAMNPASCSSQPSR